jgi:hypothetical protein
MKPSIKLLALLVFEKNWNAWLRTSLVLVAHSEVECALGCASLQFEAFNKHLV